MATLILPAIEDAEGILRDFLPVVAPDVDEDEAVKQILASMKILIIICSTARENPKMERIMSHILNSFIVPDGIDLT